jgi:hypothetical protein
VTRRLPLALAVAAVAVMLVPAGDGIRIVAVLPFLVLAPGLSLIPLLRLGDRLAELVLGVALSLSLDLLVAQVMVYADGWRPEAGVVAIAGICLCGVALQPANTAERRDGA